MHARTRFTAPLIAALWCACSSPQPADGGGSSDATDTVTPDASSDATDAIATDAPPTDANADATANDAPDVATSDAMDAMDVAPVDASDASDAPRTDAPFDVPLPDSFMIDGGTVCNTTANDGPMVLLVSGSGPPPVGTGGAITAGHYQLTSIVIYGSTVPPGVMVQEAIDLTPTNVFRVLQNTGAPLLRSTGSYAAAGSTITTMLLCPTVSTSTMQFTASPIQIVTMQTNTGLTTVSTFALH
jgi:hypothetical protein